MAPAATGPADSPGHVRTLLELHLASVQALLKSPALGGRAAGTKRPAPAATEGGPAHKTLRTDAGSSAVAGEGWDADTASLATLRTKLRGFAADRDWDQFHKPRNLALALVGEIGELCECFQWKGDAGAEPGLPEWDDEKRAHLGDELADCLLYLVRLADKCAVDLPAAAQRKLAKNAEKYPAGAVRGDARKYNEY